MLSPITPKVHFSGKESRRLKQSIKAAQAARKKAEQDAAALAEKKAADAKNKAFQAKLPEIKEALADVIYSDQQGDFQGWHLLKLIKDSKFRRYKEYGERNFFDQIRYEAGGDPKITVKGGINADTLKDDFRELNAASSYNRVVQKFLKTGLLTQNYRGMLIITHLGKQALSELSKDFDKAGKLSGKRGKYTFK